MVTPKGMNLALRCLAQTRQDGTAARLMKLLPSFLQNENCQDTFFKSQGIRIILAYLASQDWNLVKDVLDIIHTLDQTCPDQLKEQLGYDAHKSQLLNLLFRLKEERLRLQNDDGAREFLVTLDKATRESLRTVHGFSAMQRTGMRMLLDKKTSFNCHILAQKSREKEAGSATSRRSPPITELWNRPPQEDIPVKVPTQPIPVKIPTLPVKLVSNAKFVVKASAKISKGKKEPANAPQPEAGTKSVPVVVPPKSTRPTKIIHVVNNELHEPGNVIYTLREKILIIAAANVEPLVAQMDRALELCESLAVRLNDPSVSETISAIYSALELLTTKSRYFIYPPRMPAQFSSRNIGQCGTCPDPLIN